MFNAMDTASAIRSFFGADSQMINHAVRILSEAGFSEDAETFEEMGDTPLG
jgi:RNA-splicing ligase RtcB